MPAVIHLDLVVTLNGPQPSTWSGTATLRYHNPWQMTADYFQMQGPGGQLTQQCFADLFFPDGVHCTYSLGVYLPLGSAVVYTLVQRSFDLLWRAAPTLPWQPTIEPFQIGQRAATIVLAFRA